MSEELEAREIAAEQAVRRRGLRPARGVHARTRRRWRPRGTTAAGWARGRPRRARRDGLPGRASGSPSSTPPTRGWSSAGSTCDPAIDPRAALHRPHRRCATPTATSLLIDWRAPAAAVFYQATAADPAGRRTPPGAALRWHRTVVGVEDELLDDQAETDLPIVGEGALMAQLSRARDRSMHSIVATIQAEQDKAIRAPGKGVVSISGGPGTGKTVVALHRAAFLLYTDRRRYEGGGVLVVGPSGVFMRYIERVLPSLGETAVALRSLGEVVDGVRATRHDEPAVADVKGVDPDGRAAAPHRAPARARRARRASGSSGATTTIVLDRGRARPAAPPADVAGPAQPPAAARGHDAARRDVAPGHAASAAASGAARPSTTTCSATRTSSSSPSRGGRRSTRPTVFGWLRDPEFLARVGEGVRDPRGAAAAHQVVGRRRDAVDRGRAAARRAALRPRRRAAAHRRRARPRRDRPARGRRRPAGADHRLRARVRPRRAAPGRRRRTASRTTATPTSSSTRRRT